MLGVPKTLQLQHEAVLSSLQRTNFSGLPGRAASRRSLAPTGALASPKQSSEGARRLLVGSRETSWIGLGDPGRHSAAEDQFPARRSRPSSRPGPGCSHAPSATRPGSRISRTWPTTLGPKRATRGGSSLPETVFRGGEKTVGWIPRDELDRAWGPRPPFCRRG